jgi:hypothetical protein
MLCELASDESEIRIRQVQGLALPGADDDWIYQWPAGCQSPHLRIARRRSGYFLWFPGLLRCVIARDGATVDISPEDNIGEETLEHLVLDQVLPRIVTHRGRPVLHAGGVILGGRAIGLLGDTGRGKSTLVASFASARVAVLSDDGLVLDLAESSARVAATYPGLRVWPDSLEHAFIEPPAIAPMAHYSTKRRVTSGLQGPALGEGAPLGGLYVLGDEAAERDAILIEALTIRDATMAIISNTFQLDVTDKRREAKLFDTAVSVAEQVPAYLLRYPRDYKRLGDVRRAIEEHAAALG